MTKQVWEGPLKPSYPSSKPIKRLSSYSNEQKENGDSITRPLPTPLPAPIVTTTTTTTKTVRIPVVDGEICNDDRMIALFGIHSKTGIHFVRLALDAGYKVQALVPPHVDVSDLQNQQHFCSIRGEMHDVEAIEQVVAHAQYVVCMLNDTITTSTMKCDYPIGTLQNFVRLLYSIMKKQQPPSIQVLLWQATSLASSMEGSIPIMSHVLKSVSYRHNLFYQDQDAVIQFIGEQHGQRERKPYDKNDKNNNNNKTKNDHACVHDYADTMFTMADFSFIITRPTIMLMESASKTKLSASKSQPGPFPITHIDLAEFSLNALLKKKLYNTCPYVVP